MRLLSGEFLPGARLPGIREAAKEFQVQPLTVAAAYRRLAKEGLVSLRHGSGTFATDRKSAVDRVREKYRMRLVSGNFLPGARLPGIREAAKEFRVPPETVAVAYRRLAEEGLVSLRHGSGTFAADRRAAAEVLCLTGARETEASALATIRLISHYQHVGEAPISCRIMQRDRATILGLLKKKAEQGVLRGVWMGFMDTHWVMDADVFLSRHGIPLIHLSPYRKVTRYSVGVDYVGMLRAGTRHLVDLGCRSIVCVAHEFDAMPENEEAFVSTCEALGVRHTLVNRDFEPDDAPAANFERFGMQVGASLVAEGIKKHDGMLITDDVIGRGVLMSLLARGVRVPEDLKVCTHARRRDSYPDIFSIPVARMETDEMEYTSAAHQLMARLVAGESIETPHVRIPARLVPAGTEPDAGLEAGSLVSSASRGF
jgi:DNA-binding transcriptional regulator YhcF (GntR family)